MNKSKLKAVFLTAAVVLGSMILSPSPAKADVIYVPMQGVWKEATNVVVFSPGDHRDQGNWVHGNLTGQGGQQFRYMWQQTTQVTGTLYFDTPVGRQGPVYVQFLDANRMKWQIGFTQSVVTRLR